MTGEKSTISSEKALGYSGACELCWSQAFIESRMGPESQAEAYHRLLDENDGKPGHE